MVKILIISDGHGAIGQLNKLEAEFADADLVLFGGDFAAFGDPETGLPFLERLTALHDRVFAVSGNCDDIDFRDTLDQYDIGVEACFSYFNGLMFIGSGGGSKHTGVTPNERADVDLAADLRLVGEQTDYSAEAGAAAGGSDAERAVPDGAWNNLIVIAHNPPKDTKLDLVSGGIHVGSPLIRAFIERFQPLLVLSGHIHESFAIDTLGSTTLINPGALVEGRYAVATVSGGAKQSWKIESIELKQL